MYTTKMKRIIFDIIVIAIGFIGSVYSNIFINFGSSVYVNIDYGIYIRLNFEEYYSASCLNISERPCAFIQQISDLVDHGDILTYSEISSIEGLKPSGRGIYIY